MILASNGKKIIFNSAAGFTPSISSRASRLFWTGSCTGLPVTYCLKYHVGTGELELVHVTYRVFTQRHVTELLSS
eukprot:6308725-Ditylum_brightwellii.AAC.1